ncbi:MAG: phosphatidylglycerol lysyltransferase domain-containing protein [Clostridiales bacterium]|nr:phosphatidylglycerol lysyltransferase domain-containing protein [Clostridiales bacterium]
MIDFKRPTLEDRANFEPLLQACGFRSCEYSFTNLLTWAEAYDEGIAQVDGFAVVWVGSNGSYLWPSGLGDRKALLETLRQDSRARGVPFTLAGLTAEQCRELEGLYPGQFRFTNQEAAADYCYTVEKLSTLSGKKLHAKRNHIHRFEERYPNWHTEPLGEDNLAACQAIARDWETEEAEAGLEDWASDQGERALTLALRNRAALGLDGMVLYDGGGTDEAGSPTPDRAVAFCMGQPLGGDTYDVLFEKGYGEVQGAYAMINRQFARWVGETYPHIVYLNREDDLGEPNLRKAKRSYYPDLMVEKWSAQMTEARR